MIDVWSVFSFKGALLFKVFYSVWASISDSKRSNTLKKLWAAYGFSPRPLPFLPLPAAAAHWIFDSAASRHALTPPFVSHRSPPPVEPVDARASSVAVEIDRIGRRYGE
jgi:hypothetical protein